MVNTKCQSINRPCRRLGSNGRNSW